MQGKPGSGGASPRAEGWGAAEAFAAYEAIRPILPQARFQGPVRAIRDLDAVIGRFDAFVLDAFGVLNVGETPIPGAVDRIARMRAAGCAVCVLTNGASQPRAAALAKYHRMGFDFTADEVVASRDIAAEALARWPDTTLWAAIGPQGAGLDDLPGRLEPLGDDPTLLDRAGGFLFLGSEGWTEARQAALAAALAARPRPLLVANPDLVAPRETGLTLEPGHFAARLAELPGIGPHHFGKPHANAFDAVRRRLPPGIDPARVAMVGDTLHTDILGGRAAGFGTVLIAGHGLFAGQDPAPFMAASGIHPDFVAETT
jgi:HAD superfamily hydrolase (TIGR01450 family)